MFYVIWFQIWKIRCGDPAGREGLRSGLHSARHLIFHKKSPSLMPVFNQKISILLNSTATYGPKKSIFPFFPIFTTKTALMLIFCLKKYIRQKNAFHMHMLCQKIPILSNTQCSLVIFFRTFHEKSPAVMSISGQ